MKKSGRLLITVSVFLFVAILLPWAGDAALAETVKTTLIDHADPKILQIGLCLVGAATLLIEVWLTSTMDDSAISANVVQELAANPKTRAFAFDVESHGGIVTLSGTVRSLSDRTHAETTAARSENVRRVVNLVLVEPRFTPERTDT